MKEQLRTKASNLERIMFLYCSIFCSQRRLRGQVSWGLKEKKRVSIVVWNMSGSCMKAIWVRRSIWMWCIARHLLTQVLWGRYSNASLTHTAAGIHHAVWVLQKRCVTAASSYLFLFFFTVFLVCHEAFLTQSVFILNGGHCLPLKS